MRPFLILILLIILIIAYCIYEYLELRYRRFCHYKVDLGLDLKAVLITDLHNNPLSERDLRILRNEKPDMILIAGDLITAKRADVKNAQETLDSLSKICKVYYSLGNHELRFREDFEAEWKAFVKDMPEGCVLLDDESVSFNDRLDICGVSLDRDFYKKGRVFDASDISLKARISGSSDAKCLLLAHNPDFFDLYEREFNPDLIVSGHLHGGFVRLPFIGGLVFSCYGVKHRDKGLYAGKHIVSSGAGEHLIPLRMFNRCEIDIIEL